MRAYVLAHVWAVATAAATVPHPVSFPPPESLPAALSVLGGADLVVFDEPQPKKATRVLLATRVRAKVAKVRSLLSDPATYQRAVPSFRRAEVVAKREPNALFVRWELEVPLWNLEGKLWLRPTADGVDLELAEGDLAPGLFKLRSQAEGDDTLFWIEAHANVREANWVSRRLVARSPLSEPAMTAAAAWVLLHAISLEAERPANGNDPRRRPGEPMKPPPLDTLDATALGRLAHDQIPGATVAAVRTRANGRLERVEVSIPTKVAPEALQRALAEPRRWQALPGWKDIKPVGSTGPAFSPKATAANWEVDSHFPFVDFDAVWSMRFGPPLRGQAVSGDARGAVLGWDVVEGATAGTSIATFSLHPRLETSGYIPRKFMAAEPLLEQGLSLGLAYVDAVSLIRALTRQGVQ